MSVAEMARAIGRSGVYRLNNGLAIGVIVRDVKSAYGRVDYEIAPEAGEGTAWVDSASVDLRDDGTER